MKEFLLRRVARFLAKPWVADMIIRRAKRHPYLPIFYRDYTTLYMNRWWLFNAYDQKHRKRFPNWPSIRVHHIAKPDEGSKLHSHPWEARTFILRGYYFESTEDSVHVRSAGDTAPIRHGDFHRISRVAPGGAWTLFITWERRSQWGFK